MRLTAEELQKAKRASQRLFCQGDKDMKHTFQPAVIEGKTLGVRCIKCGYQTESTQNPK
jgi:hypothetical protein